MALVVQNIGQAISTIGSLPKRWMEQLKCNRAIAAAILWNSCMVIFHIV
jgi:hypothetical protein